MNDDTEKRITAREFLMAVCALILFIVVGIMWSESNKQPDQKTKVEIFFIHESFTPTIVPVPTRP